MLNDVNCTFNCVPSHNRTASSTHIAAQSNSRDRTFFIEKEEAAGNLLRSDTSKLTESLQSKPAESNIDLVGGVAAEVIEMSLGPPTFGVHTSLSQTEHSSVKSTTYVPSNRFMAVRTQRTAAMVKPSKLTSLLSGFKSAGATGDAKVDPVMSIPTIPQVRNQQIPNKADI